jgi:hypothetical protein
MIQSKEVQKLPPNQPTSLPSIRDRLPELISELEKSIQLLSNSYLEDSYIQAWIPLYEKAHSLKGLTRLLPCSEELRDDLISFSDTLGEAHHGNSAPRDRRLIISALTEALNALVGGGRLTFACESVKASFSQEASHEERVKLIPHPIQQINALVSKKAFEAVKLGLPMWILEEEMVLGDFMSWSKQIQSLLRGEDRPHGFVIHLAPHLISGSSSLLEAMAWFAVIPSFDTGIAERFANKFPRAKLRSCPA